TLAGRDAARARHVATSVAATRDLLPKRLVLESDDPTSWEATLAAFATDGAADGVILDGAVGRDAPVAFAYSGNGSQWAGMGRRLHAQDAAFRARLAEIDERFGAVAGWSVLAALFADDLADKLKRAEFAQPLLFATQEATTAALAAAGVTPDVTLGHSVGEVAAALASGALTLDQACAVVHSRSLHQEIAWKAGVMAAVLVPADEARDLIAAGGFGGVEIAAVNSARSITLSGPETEIRELSRFARSRRVAVRVLDIDYPFHTGLIEGVREPLLNDLAGFRPRATRVPFVSSVTGTVVEGAALDAGYWWDNVRQPVLFADAVEAAAALGARVFVEIGPRPVLQTYMTDVLAAAEVTSGVVNCDDHGAGEHDPIRRALAKLVAKGGRVARDVAFGRPNGPAVRLPTYPWQNVRFAVGVTADGQALYQGYDRHPLIGARLKTQSDEWNAHLDPAVAPLIADHKVGGRVVAPAAALAEMALAAGRAWLKTEAVELSDFEISHALTLDADAIAEVRTRISAESRTVEILSRPRLRSEDWTLHAVGRVAPVPSARPAVEETVTPAGAPRAEGAGLYALAGAYGLDFGPAFQAVSHVERLAQDRLRVTLKPAAERGPRDDRYGLHPADFDACFHGLLTLFGDAGDRPDMTYLPMRFGTLRLHAPGATIARAEIAIRRFSPRSIDAAFTLFDADGAVIATLSDARFRAVTLARRTPLERLSYHAAPALIGPGPAAAPVE
ncbi:acyltransferase domain-containing protein, partial [Methylopila musalis]